jgi:hypothetical protein
VRVDTSRPTPAVIGRLQGVGKKAHGLVKWHGAYVLLDSDSGALSVLRIGAGGASLKKVWAAPEPHRFLKGLAVVDDVAYFGISEWAPRSARDDPKSSCELAAFDLLHSKLLWRRKVGAVRGARAPRWPREPCFPMDGCSQRPLRRRGSLARCGGAVWL